MLETTTEDRERDRGSADEAAAGLGRTDSDSEGSSAVGKMPPGSTGRSRETVTDEPSRRRTARLSYEPARPRRPPAPSTLMGRQRRPDPPAAAGLTRRKLGWQLAHSSNKVSFNEGMSVVVLDTMLLHSSQTQRLVHGTSTHEKPTHSLASDI